VICDRAALLLERAAIREVTGYPLAKEGRLQLSRTEMQPMFLIIEKQRIGLQNFERSRTSIRIVSL
jgi:hypothetical protein